MNSHEVCRNPRIHSIALSTDSDFVATGTLGGVIDVYRVKYEGDVLRVRTITAHTAAVTCLHFLAKTPCFIVSGSINGTIVTSDAYHDTSSPIEFMSQRYTSGVTCMAISGDNHFYAAGRVDGSFQIWKDNGESVHAEGLVVPFRRTAVSSIAFSQSDDRFVAADTKGRILFMTVDGKSRMSIDTNTPTPPLSISISHENRFVLLGRRSKSFCRWDTFSGGGINDSVSEIMVHHEAIYGGAHGNTDILPRTLAFSISGELAFTTGIIANLVWYTSTSNDHLAGLYEQGHLVKLAVLSLDGARRVLTCGVHGDVRIWALF